MDDRTRTGDIERRVRDILSVVAAMKARGDDLAMDQPLRNYGLNSLGTILLIDRIEEAFGFTFDDADLTDRNFATIADLVATIQRRLQR